MGSVEMKSRKNIFDDGRMIHHSYCYDLRINLPFSRRSLSLPMNPYRYAAGMVTKEPASQQPEATRKQVNDILEKVRKRFVRATLAICSLIFVLTLLPALRDLFPVLPSPTRSVAWNQDHVLLLLFSPVWMSCLVLNGAMKEKER